MTTCRSAGVARYLRRPLLEAFIHDHTSSHPAPSLKFDFVGRRSGSCVATGEYQGLGTPRLCSLFLVCPTDLGHRRPSIEFQYSSSPAISCDNVELSEGGRWTSFIKSALTQSRAACRNFCGESTGRRGDDIALLEKEELHPIEYGVSLPERLESDSRWNNLFIYPINAIGKESRCHRLLQVRYHTFASIVEGNRWMRITGTYGGPLAAPVIRHPFLEGSVRFKSKKKIKKAKAKKREILQKIKRIRVLSRKRREDMTPEEKLEFRIRKGRSKMELIKQAIAKFPVQEIPPKDMDVEVLTPEQLHYLKKIGYKNKNYVPVGRRGIYGGTIQNIHMHWKKHETVQVEIAGFSKEEIRVMAIHLERLSGGLVIDIHQSNVVILYRGRNYQQPKNLIPIKTLDKRKALMKSKLEQSLKAHEDHDKKLHRDLAALRKENALKQSPEWVDYVAQEKENVARRKALDLAFPLEDPEDYPGPSVSDQLEDVYFPPQFEFPRDGLELTSTPSGLESGADDFELESQVDDSGLESGADDFELESQVDDSGSDSAVDDSDSDFAVDDFHSDSEVGGLDFGSEVDDTYSDPEVDDTDSDREVDDSEVEVSKAVVKSGSSDTSFSR